MSYDQGRALGTDRGKRGPTPLIFYFGPALVHATSMARPVPTSGYDINGIIEYLRSDVTHVWSAGRAAREFLYVIWYTG